MRPVISLLAKYVAEHSTALLPALLFLTSTLTEVATPTRHSLLITFISWAIIWVYNVLRVGLFSGLKNVYRARLSWTAGGFFALTQICQRAAWDREGVWLFKALLPLLVLIILETSTPVSSTDDRFIQHDRARNAPRLGLAMVTILALCSLGINFITNQGIALGLCTVLASASGFAVLERVVSSIKDDKHEGRGYMLANGSFSRRRSSSSASRLVGHPGPVIRDVAAVIAVATAVASFMFESFRTDPIFFELQLSRFIGGWQVVENGWLKLRIILMIGANIIENTVLFTMIQESGAFTTSFVTLAACLVARLVTGFSFWNAWFTFSSAVAIAIYLGDLGPSGHSNISGQAKRIARQVVVILGTVSVLLLVATRFRQLALGGGYQLDESNIFEVPKSPLGPMEFASLSQHPVGQLVKNGESAFQKLLDRQSTSLAGAVEEYRRRYKMHPPPNFDRWYEYATRRGIRLIDEFDSIHETLLPFWGLEPSTIRARAREALGNPDNFLIGVLIRDGSVVKIERGDEWQQQATVGMLNNFVQNLPDMDLAFNMHDEPRVVVPYDRLSQLVALAQEERLPRALANSSPRNGYSTRPKDMNDGRRIEPLSHSRFNHFAHQATWTHSRLSCSPNSPAHSYEEQSADNITAYALGDLGFVYNTTALADICMLPSLRKMHAFFDCPNAYNLVTELFPVFSQSKISSYQDIIYPSPWYWAHRVNFDQSRDKSWSEKFNSLYWRGSTTGGYSRSGGWRRHHRQHVVRKMTGLDTASIMVKAGTEESPEWRSKEVKRGDFKELIDIHFSHVGQCDPADCEAQIEFFDVVERVDSQEAWQWKHLLDIDGNAFSGRFYAFLQSTSLVYKISIFQEWHREWVKPWVHYIPLSLRGDEWLETLRYFSSESEGQEQAPRMAMQGSKWAGEALRNEDMEAWFFRLLLEYGRLTDDDRENIGYSGP